MTEITNPTEVPSAPTESLLPTHQPVAPYWHTALIVVLMAAVATLSALGHKQSTSPTSPMGSYVSTFAWQWLLFGLVYFGIRRQGVTLGDLLGRRWHGFDDVLMDVVYAAAFFVVSKLVLALVVVAALKVLQMPADTFTLKKSVDAVGSLTPRTAAEIVAWIGLSMTAGFVEEVVFRGYLQRQLSALTRNAAAGILISALIFGAAHAYQGLQMVIIAALGAMFGVFAHWRKSLKPGILSHAGQDIFSGLALSWLSRHPLS